MVRASVSSRNKSNNFRNRFVFVAGAFFLLAAVVFVSQSVCSSSSAPPILLASEQETTKLFTPSSQEERNALETALPNQRDFLAIAQATGTDKVGGQKNLDEQIMKFAQAANYRCKFWGHFYHTFYQRWLAAYSSDVKSAAFQFLEIGYSNGAGFAAFLEFLSPQAQLHSIEYECNLLEKRQSEHPWHKEHKANQRFHCGDASDYEFLIATWRTMKNSNQDAPLKVVVDDASHRSHHQAASVFFWFPRLAPGGLMIIEDVQPNGLSNDFRNEFLPQVMVDLHYCGDPNPALPPDVLCFPTLQPLLKSIHCEMHICVLERNEMPAVEYSKKDSTSPPNALRYDMCRDWKMKARHPSL